MAELFVSSKTLPEWQNWLSTTIDDIFDEDRPSSAMRVFFNRRGSKFFSHDTDIQVYHKLPGMLMNSSPPSVDDLYDAPAVHDFDVSFLKERMAVYGCVMEKEPELDENDNIVTTFRPRLGIGSATSKQGSIRRLNDYPKGVALPSRVKISQDEGYVITHLCILMLMKLCLDDIYVQRGTFLILETTLT